MWLGGPSVQCSPECEGHSSAGQIDQTGLVRMRAEITTPSNPYLFPTDSVADGVKTFHVFQLNSDR
jgi:hypothetical protein